MKQDIPLPDLFEKVPVWIQHFRLAWLEDRFFQMVKTVQSIYFHQESKIQRTIDLENGFVVNVKFFAEDP